MATTIETALKRFASATMLMKIVVINIAVFLVLNIISIVMIFAGEESGRFIVEQWVAMPGNFGRLARHAWTPLSYMFCQIEPLHLIFNILWLYWFGIVFQLLSTPKRMIGLCSEVSEARRSIFSQSTPSPISQATADFSSVLAPRS